MEIKFEFNPNHLQYFPLNMFGNYTIFDTTAYTKTDQKVDQTDLNKIKTLTGFDQGDCRKETRRAY